MSKFVTPPGGNKMYMTCQCGLDPFELCRRSSLLYRAGRTIQFDFDDWLDKHSGCVKGPDHFRIGLERQPNWDQPIDADPVDNAVRLALVKS